MTRKKSNIKRRKTKSITQFKNKIKYIDCAIREKKRVVFAYRAYIDLYFQTT